jgi:uncharacterized NAD(P)/FAD-binding protein YdhS
MGATARGYLRALRRAIEGEQRRGRDWRDVVAALRPHTPALWQRLEPGERARFERHLRRYWDAHRHRCAPEAHQAFHELIAAGRVRVIAGRIEGCRAEGPDLVVTVRRRGDGVAQALRVGSVVNCTGPTTDVRHMDDPLVRDLLRTGRIAPDPLGLGLTVSADYAVCGSLGQPSASIHYVGPLLKARDWEATAVPELRVHVERLARHLLAT